MQEIEQFISEHDLCSNPTDYLYTQSSLKSAWDNCDRGDWLLWTLAALDVEHKTLVTLVCHIARHTPLKDGRTVWDIMPHEGHHAIETIEAWLEDRASLEEVRAAGSAALYAGAHAGAYPTCVVDANASLANATADAAGSAIDVVGAYLATDIVNDGTYLATSVAHAAAHGEYLVNTSAYLPVAAARTATHADYLVGVVADAQKWQADYIREQISWSDVLERLEE